MAIANIINNKYVYIGNIYLTELKFKGYSKNTIRTYRYTLKHTANTLGEMDIRVIKAADILKAISNDNASPNTVAARLSALKTFFKWLFDKKIIDRDPLEGISSVRTKEEPVQNIPADDLEVILKAINNLPIQPKVFFLLISELGLKPGETLALTVQDIKKIESSNPSPDLKMLLESMPAGSKKEALFKTSRGYAATYDWAYYWWEKVMAECNMEYNINHLRYGRKNRHFDQGEL